MAVLLDQSWVKVQAKTFTKWSVIIAIARVPMRTVQMLTRLA